MSILLDALNQAEQKNQRQTHSLKPNSSPGETTLLASIELTKNKLAEKIDSTLFQNKNIPANTPTGNNQETNNADYDELTPTQSSRDIAFPKLYFFSVGTSVFLFVCVIALLYLQLNNDNIATNTDLQTNRITASNQLNHSIVDNPAPAVTKAATSIATPLNKVQANTKTAREHVRSQPAPKVAKTISTAQVTLHSPSVAPNPVNKPPYSSKSVVPITRKNFSGDIDTAYYALTSGNLESAENQYRALLRLHPKNKDVLYGMASVSARQNEHKRAAEYYLKLSTLFPDEHHAQAALSTLFRELAPKETHLLLADLVQKNPGSAELVEIFGNSFAQHKDWINAQQQYFRAVTLKPDNPNFAFNLAISLDHLGKKTAALNYYQRCLELINNTTTPNFDSSIVKNRVAILTQQSQL